MKQQYKWERREKKYKRKKKMIVDGKSVFVIEKAVNERGKCKEKVHEGI
ncbi:MAG: hypothetical protein WC449_05135 [Candidatus Paceibacterota bacterium]